MATLTTPHRPRRAADLLKQLENLDDTLAAEREEAFLAQLEVQEADREFGEAVCHEVLCRQ